MIATIVFNTMCGIILLALILALAASATADGKVTNPTTPDTYRIESTLKTFGDQIETLGEEIKTLREQIKTHDEKTTDILDSAIRNMRFVMDELRPKGKAPTRTVQTTNTGSASRNSSDGRGGGALQ